MPRDCRLEVLDCSSNFQKLELGKFEEFLIWISNLEIPQIVRERLKIFTEIVIIPMFPALGFQNLALNF